jgi:excisionase family DNA binding protein
MSSNIKIQRICQHCGNEFTARTTTTLYCSKKCNSADYKAKIRTAKVEVSNKQTLHIKTKPIEELKAKDFLTVRDVAKLIGCSRQTVYTLINTGRLKGVNIKIKKTIIQRSEIDKLFEHPVTPQPDIKPEIKFETNDCYTITETQNKYGISDSALNNVIKRFSVPKIKKGKFTYVPKTIIDKILS